MVTKADEKWDEVGDNPLVIMSEIKRLRWDEEIKEFMDDDDLEYVLDAVVKIMSGDNPDITKIPMLCVRLEAFNLKYRTQFAAFMGPLKGTTDANSKKNMYKELYTGIDRLVDALKYMTR